MLKAVHRRLMAIAQQRTLRERERHADGDMYHEEQPDRCEEVGERRRAEAGVHPDTGIACLLRVNEEIRSDQKHRQGAEAGADDPSWVNQPHRGAVHARVLE